MDIKEEKIPVNDGGGLYDRDGMIDGLIVDCDEVMKAIMAGSGIRLAALLVEMVQKLTALKKGVAEEVGVLTQERDQAREYADEMARALLKSTKAERDELKQKPPDQAEHAEHKAGAGAVDGYWEDV